MIFRAKKAVLVDLDGTLADSLGSLKEVYGNFLKEFRITGSVEEFEFLNGRTLPQIIRILKEKYGLRFSVEELERIYRQHIQDVYARSVVPHHHAVETLVEIKKRGALVGLVTAAKADIASAFLKANRLEGLWDVLITAEEGEPGKPDPALYVRALKMLKLDKSEAIVIEDSTNGVQAALSAGIDTVWVFHSEKSDDERLLFGTDWLEVKKILDEFF